jgi:hypothetical protein
MGETILRIGTTFREASMNLLPRTTAFPMHCESVSIHHRTSTFEPYPYCQL